MDPIAAPLVRVDGLVKTFGGAEPVLRDVAFELRRGDVVSLTGASGSGKSTLLSVLAALATPDRGRVLFDGEDLTQLSDERRAQLRAGRIGTVLQSGNLIPFLTAAQNLDLARRFGRTSASEDRRGDTAGLLAELGVGHRTHHLPRRMSGGEAQRVAIAVALANDPDLLLADEVTGQLDSGTADQVMTTILDASHARGLTVLFVTHSEELAGRAARRLTLHAGGVHER